ncbi:hypothetical protein BLGI_4257 [Brevibacillus laterosporus GI-9]|uniref:hypothetical protein n=1 Tax=Brevibacillus laterosporus TaxID=1465 RepID=UPI000240517C|nr:hypothetical protein [Brevibacillus laterosporus]CCF16289.1 hypothetical protein BLGI_4257 [Brevibacillus laterosporus GI-9]
MLKQTKPNDIMIKVNSRGFQIFVKERASTLREWQQSHNVVEAPLNGGVHSYMKTKERISETKVKTNLLKRGIIIDTVDRYYMKDSEKELLWRINVSNVEEARIAKALGEVAEVLRL